MVEPAVLLTVNNENMCPLTNMYAINFIKRNWNDVQIGSVKKLKA